MLTRGQKKKHEEEGDEVLKKRKESTRRKYKGELEKRGNAISALFHPAGFISHLRKNSDHTVYRHYCRLY